MPLSVFRKLGFEEAKPTSVTLLMVYRSLKRTKKGVIKDVLVKVDKVIFIADFIMPNMEEDKDIPK